MNTKLAQEESALVVEYTAWLDSQALPHGCAIELACEAFVTNDQNAWLRDFIERWEDLMERQSDAMRGAA